LKGLPLIVSTAVSKCDAQADRTGRFDHCHRWWIEHSSPRRRDCSCR
jgi:hypothetical protein